MRPPPSIALPQSGDNVAVSLRRTIASMNTLAAWMHEAATAQTDVIDELKAENERLRLRIDAGGPDLGLVVASCHQ